jgi:hypothetical protein
VADSAVVEAGAAVDLAVAADEAVADREAGSDVPVERTVNPRFLGIAPAVDRMVFAERLS